MGGQRRRWRKKERTFLSEPIADIAIIARSSPPSLMTTRVHHSRERERCGTTLFTFFRRPLVFVCRLRCNGGINFGKDVTLWTGLAPRPERRTPRDVFPRRYKIFSLYFPFSALFVFPPPRDLLPFLPFCRVTTDRRFSPLSLSLYSLDTDDRH